MKADLHIHSNYSDSSRSITEIIDIAKAKGLSLISICDHATIEAYDELPDICKVNSIDYILGIELVAKWRNADIHMLAYDFDKNNIPMKKLIEEQHRDIECEYIVYNMIKDYPQMSLEDFRAFEYPKDKGGWKYLYYAVAKGAASSYDEAGKTIYQKYSSINLLSSFSVCSLQEFCEVVSDAGGVPVLAHPKYLYDIKPSEYIDVLQEMTEYGIKGIECFYPSHSKEFTDVCIGFCKNNDLRITGGCDCHGEYDLTEGFSVGNLDIPIDMLDLRGIR